METNVRARVRLLIAGMTMALTLLLSACMSPIGSTGAPGDSADSGGSAVTPATSAAQTSTQSLATTPVEEATAAVTDPVTPAVVLTATEPEMTPTDSSAVVETASPTAAATVQAESEPTQTSVPTLAASPTSAPTAAVSPDLASLKLALTPVVQGLANPLFITHAGDGSGRLFVVEKRGAIRIISDGQALEAPFLEIVDRVGSSASEQGLLGLAFPPDYNTRKFFFVNYTDKNGDTVVSRFSVTEDPNVADAGSEFVILTFDQPAANHNGGGLAFGPDGYLWIGTGDGGAANDRFGNGQNPETWLAKMLRIDVTSDPTKPYQIPPDNPSLSQGWQVEPEIWAIGLRNPWRYSFDRETGDLWIGDVGQNLIEEIHVARAGSAGGLNFGWPIMEGPNCFQTATCDKAGLELPVASYQHGADGCSVTGGYVYRGEQSPSLVGVYLYGDYCSGRIWALDAAEPGQPRLVLEAGAGLSSFGEDENGELYITDLAKGTVRRIEVE